MRLLVRFVVIFGLGLSLTLSAAAQDRAETLADIRQDLTLLNIEVKRLRRELSTTGGSDVSAGSGTLLDRVQVIEAELSRLTGKTEELEYRIDRIVTDGTNRIGDLEFRLVELEGGDVGALGETSTLGGEEVATPAAPQPIAPPEGEGPALAMSEEEDFRRAEEALAAGDYQRAAELFGTFNETYPGGPLGPGALLGRGEALEKMGNTKEAARAYLDAYSLARDAQATAAPALLNLGRALASLGQNDAACQMLAEIAPRFPSATELTEAQTEMGRLGCS
ncbi:MAG: tetratricopeptide repeat protein [Marinovum algicola]|uniref:Cell division coordinator CpoB n=1 Tax=Marinovum algicola TaxID=42444 RepID=A0A975W5Y8_9RHOB|nr:tetratricopeptide repeat protein [Marinovum algicola]SEI52084.1 tol-pal system protein YbgF [Marinovum algicola]SLN30009.1 Tetratricopeptide repeat protein [Marinovum algicola]